MFLQRIGLVFLAGHPNFYEMFRSVLRGGGQLENKKYL